MKLKPILLSLTIFMVAALLSPKNAAAMPNFARKLGWECSQCHTTIPRLNELGYKFRAAGWRLPEEIGTEDKKFELGDYFSGRIQARYDGSQTKTGTVASHKSQLSFHEFTIYPITGAFKKYYSSLVEMSFLPHESPEVENAYVRLNKGNQDQFFQIRFGIFHPFEGFGGSDRPFSISRPFFQSNAANFNQNTFFKPWGFDQAGAEVGYDRGRASIRATVFNGLVLREENGSLTAVAAQGGALGKSSTLPSASTPDLQLFANYILNSEGGGLSAYYYHGNFDLQVPGGTNFFRNRYDRVAFYAAYPLIKQLHLLGGYQTAGIMLRPAAHLRATVLSWKSMPPSIDTRRQESGTTGLTRQPTRALTMCAASRVSSMCHYKTDSSLSPSTSTRTRGADSAPIETMMPFNCASSLFSETT